MVTPRQSLRVSGGARAQQQRGVTPFQASNETALVGEAMLTAGVQGFQLSKAMQEDLDQANTRMAITRLSELLNTTEAEFDQVGGADVAEVFKQTQDKLQKSRVELEKSLTSSRQRQAFGLAADARMNAALTRMSSTRAKKLKDYNIAATTATVQEAITNRVNAYLKGDVRGWIAHSAEMTQTMDHLAQLTGVPPEAAALAKENAESEIHASIMDGLLNQGKTSRARGFLEEHGELIQDPIKRTGLEKRLQAAEDDEVAERVIDGIRREHPGSIVDQRRALRSMKLTEGARTKALARLRYMFSEDRDERERERSEALDDAENLVKLGRPLPESLSSRLRDLGVFEKFQAANLRANKPHPRETNEAGKLLMLKFIAQPSTMLEFGTPEALLNAVRYSMSDADLKQLAGMWDQAVNRQLNANEIVKRYKSGRESSAGARSPGVADGIAKFDGLKADRAQMLLNQLRLSYSDSYTQAMAQPKDLSGELASEFYTLLPQVDAAANRIAQTETRNPNEHEVYQRAIDEVLALRTAGGRPYAGLGPVDRAAASVVMPDGETFTPDMLLGPGENDPALAQRRLETAFDQVRLFTAQNLVKRQDPTKEWDALTQAERDVYLQTAEDIVTPQMAYEVVHETRKQLNTLQDTARETLDEYDVISEELEQASALGLDALSPELKERSAGIRLAEDLWSVWTQQEETRRFDQMGATDVEVFVETWPRFYELYGSQLASVGGARPGVGTNQMFGAGPANTTYASAAESQMRNAMVKILFGNASQSEQRMIADAALRGDRPAGPEQRQFVDTVRSRYKIEPDVGSPEFYIQFGEIAKRFRR